MTAWRTGPEVAATAADAVGADAVAADVPRLGGCDGCLAEDLRRVRWDDPHRRPAVTSPEAAGRLLSPLLQGRDRERCVALLLDTKHRLIRQATVSIGTVDHTFVNPREIFRDALLANASALVLAHNHPSGDATPSRDDELVTRRVQQAGELLGVELLDHLVIGAASWVSLARRGSL